MQRAAAAANERKVLDAARTLFAAPLADVDMREIARVAGVGVGTLYRRFGDKSGLLAAVVGEDERALQEAVLYGPPPLGPGAAERERLAAFLEALVALTERNLGALLLADGTARLTVGAYQGWRLHVVTLLRALQSDLSARDAGWHADVLLAVVDPPLYTYHRRELGLSQRRITANAASLVALLSG
jgi:AcrR family transcriptional regulator